MTTKRNWIDADELHRMYKKRAKAWGERFLLRNWWKLRGVYDRSDLKQEAFYAYLRVCRTHPSKSEADLYRLYKSRLRGRLRNNSKTCCFPNPYNQIEGVGAAVISLPEEDGPTAQMIYGQFSVSNEAELVLEILEKVPSELRSAFVLILRDFFGGHCINQRVGKRLDGGRRCEPLNVALANHLGLDRSRDLLGELQQALGVQLNE